MIPVKLTVRNFLSYREDVPTLDLTGVHVACLCGSNGHGKSALLDAITWCLWGKARGRTQDELIHYAAAEARVELEFLSRDSRFRVIRSHSRARGRNRPGATDLQLQGLVQALDGGAAQSVGGNTVRETQDKIEQLIGMSYDTFINSAFLMQGRADEFTSKTPAERKAVLSSLLDLEAYDQYQERARRRLDAARIGAERSAALVEQGRRQMEQIGDPKSELGQVTLQLEGLEIRLTAARGVEQDIKYRVDQALRQQGELEGLRGRVALARMEIDQLEEQAASSEARIREFRAIAGQGEEIDDGVGRLRRAEDRFQGLEESRIVHDKLNREQVELNQAAGLKRAQLEARLDQVSQRIDGELVPRASAGPSLAKSSREARGQLDSLSGEDEAISLERRRQQVLATQMGETQGLADRHEKEGKEVRGKLDMLRQTPGEQAVCPLCQTPLGTDGCGRLAEQYESQIEELRRMFRQTRSRLQQLKTEGAEIEKMLPQREQALATQRRDVQLRAQEVERQLAESAAAQEELARVRPELADGRRALESGEFASGEATQLREVDRQLGELGYRESDWQQCYQDIGNLRVFEARSHQLSQALERLPEEEASLTRSRELLALRREGLAAQEERVESIEVSLNGLAGLERQLAEATRELAAWEGERTSALARKGFLEGQVRRLSEVGQEVEEHSSRLKSHEAEQSIFQELATAFGRQGVQAMLIETVVPRLEEEANLLLGRMTDNRMHVKLETQRERRSGRGEPIETLEINVSDDLGPRSYEMYSGGEAFRVNLALRIGLSKVLAQRMGAPLPTLFVDEGFGTQDLAGRERILDVISAIQDEFDKIIVITHLEELKDMFPVRIEVHKDENGSTFWLN